MTSLLLSIWIYSVSVYRVRTIGSANQRRIPEKCISKVETFDQIQLKLFWDNTLAGCEDFPKHDGDLYKLFFSIDSYNEKGELFEIRIDAMDEERFTILPPYGTRKVVFKRIFSSRNNEYFIEHNQTTFPYETKMEFIDKFVRFSKPRHKSPNISIYEDREHNSEIILTDYTHLYGFTLDTVSEVFVYIDNCYNLESERKPLDEKNGMRAYYECDRVEDLKHFFIKRFEPPKNCSLHLEVCVDISLSLFYLSSNGDQGLIYDSNQPIIAELKIVSAIYSGIASVFRATNFSMGINLFSTKVEKTLYNDNKNSNSKKFIKDIMSSIDGIALKNYDKRLTSECVKKVSRASVDSSKEKTLIILTKGNPVNKEKTRENITLLRKKGWKVIVLGVGLMDEKILKNWAGEDFIRKNHYHEILMSMDEILNSILDMCVNSDYSVVGEIEETDTDDQEQNNPILVVLCEDDISLPNMNITKSEPCSGKIIGSVCNIECNERYYKHPDTIPTCSVEGTWINQPKCVLAICEKLPHIENIDENKSNSCSMTFFGKTCEIECLENHIKYPGDPLCTPQGVWKEVPRCLKKKDSLVTNLVIGVGTVLGFVICSGLVFTFGENSFMSGEIVEEEELEFSIREANVFEPHIIIE